jgi:hypothetical protein
MADEPKTVTIWDGAITYERPEYDAETKTLLAAIETSLAKFGRHKDALLAILRDGHERGLKSAPVDADGTKSTPFDADTGAIKSPTWLVPKRDCRQLLTFGEGK